MEKKQGKEYEVARQTQFFNHKLQERIKRFSYLASSAMIKFPIILAMTLEQNSPSDSWARLILLHRCFWVDRLLILDHVVILNNSTFLTKSFYFFDSRTPFNPIRQHWNRRLLHNLKDLTLTEINLDDKSSC